MDDQPFAGKYLERRRGIEIAAGLLPVGCRAADYLVVEQEKVLDGRRYRVERCLALACGKPNFEDAVLARQHDGLAELRPNGEIGFCRHFARKQSHWAMRALSGQRGRPASASDTGDWRAICCASKVRA
jgi:hypothetical protein